MKSKLLILILFLFSGNMFGMKRVPTIYDMKRLTSEEWEKTKGIKFEDFSTSIDPDEETADDYIKKLIAKYKEETSQAYLDMLNKHLSDEELVKSMKQKHQRYEDLKSFVYDMRYLDFQFGADVDSHNIKGKKRPEG